MIKIVLFEPPTLIKRLSPISVTRPLFEIRMGGYSLRELLATLVRTLPEQSGELYTLAPSQAMPHADKPSQPIPYSLDNLRLRTTVLPASSLASEVIAEPHSSSPSTITPNHNHSSANTILYLNAALIPDETFINKLLKEAVAFHQNLTHTRAFNHSSSANANNANNTDNANNANVLWVEQEERSTPSSKRTQSLLTLETIIGWLSSESVPTREHLLEAVQNSLKERPYHKNSSDREVPKVLIKELHEILNAHERLLAAHIALKVKSTPSARIQELAPNVFIKYPENKTPKPSSQDDDYPNHSTFDKSTFKATPKNPILLEHNTSIGAYSVLSGPLYIGANSRIAPHSILTHSSLGHHTRIGGEISHAIFHDFSNKSHFGFIGHSVIGSWVNLGAGTTTSNLKNTYEAVTLKRLSGGSVQTGRTFVGAFIGDYAKTAILTGIYGGRSLGVAANALKTVTHNLPHFSFLVDAASPNHSHLSTESTFRDKPSTSKDTKHSKSTEEYKRTRLATVKTLSLESVLATQKTMFARRDLLPTPEQIALLETLYALQKDALI